MSGSFDEGNLDALDIAFPMFITIAILVLCFTDAALSHASSRQTKFLRRLKMTPVAPSTYLLTGIIIRLGVIVAFAGLFSVVTSVAFGLSLLNRNWLIILGVLMLTFTMFYFIAMFLANVFKSPRTSQSALNIIFWIFLLLGNLFMPTNAMPEILCVISQNTPTVYALNLLQSAWLGADLFYGHSFIVVIGITIAFGVLSAKFFKYE